MGALPGTVHAEVVIADDFVRIGTVHLDGLGAPSQLRSCCSPRSGELAAMLEERPFAPDIARRRPGRSPAGARERLRS